MLSIYPNNEDTDISFNQKGLESILLGIHQFMLDAPDDEPHFTKSHVTVIRDFHSGYYKAGERFNCSNDIADAIYDMHTRGHLLVEELTKQPELQV